MERGHESYTPYYSSFNYSPQCLLISTPFFFPPLTEGRPRKSGGTRPFRESFYYLYLSVIDLCLPLPPPRKLTY